MKGFPEFVRKPLGEGSGFIGIGVGPVVEKKLFKSIFRFVDICEFLLDFNDFSFLVQGCGNSILMLPIHRQGRIEKHIEYPNKPQHRGICQVEFHLLEVGSKHASFVERVN